MTAMTKSWQNLTIETGSTEPEIISTVTQSTSPIWTTASVSVKVSTATGGSTTTSVPLSVFSSSSTQSPSPWRDVSFGLIGGLVLLLFICIILCIVLKRLKQTLGRAQRTYYHETMASEHSYTTLQKDGTERRTAPSVELRSVVHFEEEVDSPVFSPSPGIYPKPPTKPPPAGRQSSISDTQSDIPPQLPSRRQKITLASDTGKKNTSKTALLNSTDTNNSIESGVDNKGFVEEERLQRAPPTVKFKVDYEDDDDMYESYDHSLYSNIQRETDENDSVDDNMSYEEKESTNKKNVAGDQFIKRQSSASGLPESVFKEESSDVEDPASSSIPLQDADIYDNDEVKDSGLPADIDPQSLDDLAMYEDLDEPPIIEPFQTAKTQLQDADSGKQKISDNVVDNIPTCEQFSDNASLSDTDSQLHEIQNEATVEFDMSMPSSVSDVPLSPDVEEEPYPPLPDEPPPPLPINPAPELFASEGDMDLEQIYDEGEIGEKLETDQDEIMLYEDFPTETKSQSNVLVSGHSVDYQTETLPAESEMKHQNNVKICLNSADNGDDIRDTTYPLPKVPPRRSLSSNENNQTIDNDRGLINNDVISSPVQLRSPKLASDILVKEDSKNIYFLDVDDNSGELSEQQQKRISVIKPADQEVPLKELINLYGQPNLTNIHPGADELMNISENKLTEKEMTGNISMSDDTSSETEEAYYDDDLYDTPPPVPKPAQTD